MKPPILREIIEINNPDRADNGLKGQITSINHGNITVKWEDGTTTRVSVHDLFRE